MVSLSHSIILPLYIYPTDTTWNKLYTQVAAWPQLTFNIIVNPNSGPGASNSYPNSDYVTGLSKLNSYKNTVLFGYTYLSYGSRAVASVTADVDTYNHWSTYTAANISIDGIFFDEVPSTTATTTISYLQSISDYTRTQLPAPRAGVIFNPGVVVDASFYNYADMIVAFENSYSAFSASSITAVPAAVRSKSAFIIHGSSTSASVQQCVVSQLTSNNIKAMDITTTDGYTDWSTLWENFCNQMASTG